MKRKLFSSLSLLLTIFLFTCLFSIADYREGSPAIREMILKIFGKFYENYTGWLIAIFLFLSIVFGVLTIFIIGKNKK